MYKLKGFVTIDDYLLNSASGISSIGELSTHSLTYSKNKEIYSSASALGSIKLNSFFSKDNTGFLSVPLDIRTQTFVITNWIIDTQTGVNAHTTKTAFLSALTTQFSIALGSVNCGDLITVNNTYKFPEHISFSKIGYISSDPLFANEIKIWYCDDSFKNQYDEFELVIVAPLGTIDSFFGNKATVLAALNAYQLDSTMAAINLAKNGYPESSLTTEIYPWVNPANPLDKTNTNWTILTYGRVGNNPDAIKAAIKNYIAENTTRTEPQWISIFPDIYNNTEFLIFPRWFNYAIQEMTLTAGVHSPIVSVKKELDYIKTTLPALTSSYLDTNTQLVPFQYKSLICSFVGNLQNRDNLFKISLVFPDYINVPTSELLFNMMSAPTRDWSFLMSRLLLAAETVTVNSSIPLDMRKIVRNNILYISAKLQGIDYLVASKASTPTYAI